LGQARDVDEKRQLDRLFSQDGFDRQVKINVNILSAVWKPFLPAMDVKMIAFDWQGIGMYALSTANELYFLDFGVKKWKPIFPKVKIKDFTIKPDGTIIALSASDFSSYVRTNGKWENIPVKLAKKDSYEQVVVTISGKFFARYADNRVSDGVNTFENKYRYVSAASEEDIIYLIGTNNKIYVYFTDSTLREPSELPGKGRGKIVCGTGHGFIADIFIIGAGSNSNVYFFDVAKGANKWTVVPGKGFMKYITLHRMGILFGVGVDNKIYYLT
jgi:hypothetical protein